MLLGLLCVVESFRLNRACLILSTAALAVYVFCVVVGAAQEVGDPRTVVSPQKWS